MIVCLYFVSQRIVSNTYFFRAALPLMICIQSKRKTWKYTHRERRSKSSAPVEAVTATQLLPFNNEFNVAQTKYVVDSLRRFFFRFPFEHCTHTQNFVSFSILLLLFIQRYITLFSPRTFGWLLFFRERMHGNMEILLYFIDM